MYLTVKEVAAMLRQDPETIRRKLVAGKIPGAFKTDGKEGEWRVSKEVLDNWVKGRMVHG